MKPIKLHTGAVLDICDDDTNLTEFIQSKVNCTGRKDKDDAFLACDLGDIVKKWKRFRQNLPRVEPFYAIKCNPDTNVVKLLSMLGVNFDCASKNEIKQVLEAGVAPDRIIYANPCKQASYIKYAASKDVSLLTFDNVPELHKIKQHHPNASLLIRIKVDDSKSLCQFGIKFGAAISDIKEILEAAWKLNLNVIGVSFHVGSGCYNASMFYSAVESAYMVFKQASDIGFKFTMLDVGGGFPGCDTSHITFEEAADALNMAFEKYFPEEDGVRLIAEPGRYFVASAYTAVCCITSVRPVENSCKEVDGYMYYINDGVYGSFSCILTDHQHPIGKPLFEQEDKLLRCSLWGPTCDSMDCITKDAQLPKLNIGDWLYFDNMGAYTLASSSKFNGFKKSTVLYMCRKQFAYLMVQDDTNDVLTNKKSGSKIPVQFYNNIKAIHLN